MSEKRNLGIDLAKKGNYEEAMALFDKAMLDGDLLAINDAGVIFERQGRYLKASTCYALCGSLGTPVSIYNLANFYRHGSGVKQSYQIAARLYLRAAKLGYPTGYFQLAEMLFYGQGYKKDKKRALRFLKKGYKLEKKSEEHFNCTAQLGYYYESGTVVKASIRKAMKYYKEAADKGCPTAMYNLALCYMGKKNAKRYSKTIISLLTKATEENYPDAFAELARIFLEGKITEKDDDLYRYWGSLAFKKKSMRGLLYRAEDCFSGKLGEGRIDEGEYVLSLFLACHYEYKSDYNWLYNRIKSKYPDIIDWEALENDPHAYAERENSKYDC